MFNLVNYLTVERDKGVIIWLCNIGAEKYWNNVNLGMVDKQDEGIVEHIEEMNLLICRKQDIMILREEPDKDYLNALSEAGFEIPNIMVPEKSDLSSSISELVLMDEKLQKRLKEVSKYQEEVYFVPYAVTSFEEQIAEKCDLKLVGASSLASAKINDKIFNRKIAETLKFPVCKGKVCSSTQEIREEYHRLTENEPYFKKVIIKEPFGASGKGLYVIDDKAKFEGILRLISRFAKNNSSAKWLVEGWYNKKADVNYQINISEDGSVNVFSIKQQILKDTVYIGSKIPPAISRNDVEEYKKYGKKIGEYLYSIGYVGVAGIDSFITEEKVIIPIIEINGRFTLSTYISFLQDIIGSNKVETRYFKVLTNSKVNYKALKELLRDNEILFDTDKKEGVLVYVSGTLPIREYQGCNGYLGRIFALAIAKDDEKVLDYIEKLETLVEEL